MEWKSFFYGFLTLAVLLLAMTSFGFAHIGSNNSSGGFSSGSGSGSGDIPEKCRVPAGQDVGSWVEHLGHHADTQECLKYFD